MSILDPWNALFAVAFVIYVVIRGRFASQTRNNENVVRRVDGMEKLLLAGVFLTSLLLPVLYLVTPWLSFADYEIPAWVRGCGVVVMICALWLFWRSHSDLGLNWSATLEIRKNHTLVTDGVYRWIRHPMYVAIFLVCLAQGLMLDNWLAGWAAFVAFACLYIRRAPLEEQMMIEQFGDQYETYRRKTGRLIPKIF
jgi:protein-S-isoprenylcysteine O-methyltransferase Ste14